MWVSRGQETKHRERSRSPNPPPRRSPSPAFPAPHSYAAAPFHSDPYSSNYNYPASPNPYYPSPAPVAPIYGQYLTRDLQLSTVAPRLPSPNRQYQPQHVERVVHVVHHSKHHKKHKHKHGHSDSEVQIPSMPMPSPVTPSFSYPSTYTPAYPSTPIQPLPTPQRVHFSHSKPTVIPALTRKASVDALALEFKERAVLTKHPRRRTTSQPQIPAGYVAVQVNDPAHRGHKHGYILDPRNPHFRYSTCSGRRKALCIGINYLGQPNELRGCINDAKHVRRFLIEKGGYRSEDVLLLTDDARDPRNLPTRANMLHAMRWLVKSAKQNDALFFHYSGHGGQTQDLDGDEVDGWDEVIYPMDYQSAGHILDDTLNEVMVKPLPGGCRLTALFDACHSGTVLDLSYMYSSHGRLKGMHISDRHWQKKATPADVISWSGCMDGETSADTFQGGVAVGAMSHAFITALTNNPKQTYQEFLGSLRKILHPRYSQRPQLGSSHKIETNLEFIF
ncbi:hypothetical protein BDN70DRAFT_874375 [Pholiota conissans]|uniref:Peptidase C14 caspase domain-containing protein n=1 Tax=Pholiota conissans TaxID=109636 RepID=A0A9P6D3Z3_9AGAR|nr:hypothetical protein BDN70DRAFT_874375 [Pholiota conissans]